MDNNNIEPEQFSDEEMKMPNENVNPMATPEKTSLLGPIIAVLIVILVLVLGGLYMWQSTMLEEPIVLPPVERPTAEENNEPESNNAEADVQVLETVSTSNSIEAIEADIESTNLDTLDAELTAIESELDAEIE